MSAKNNTSFPHTLFFRYTLINYKILTVGDIIMKSMPIELD